MSLSCGPDFVPGGRPLFLGGAAVTCGTGESAAAEEEEEEEEELLPRESVLLDVGRFRGLLVRGWFS
jgi:hypothetical protein